MICVVYAIPTETGFFRPPLALGSLHIWCDAKCFFYARTSSHHHLPACKMVHPSRWFAGALDGSDTSRTQVALDGYVDRGVVTQTKGQDAEFHERVQEKS